MGTYAPKLCEVLAAMVGSQSGHAKAATLTVVDSFGVESLTSKQTLEVLWIDGEWYKGTVVKARLAGAQRAQASHAFIGRARVAVRTHDRQVQGGVGRRRVEWVPQ